MYNRNLATFITHIFTKLHQTFLVSKSPVIVQTHGHTRADADKTILCFSVSLARRVIIDWIAHIRHTVLITDLNAIGW